MPEVDQQKPAATHDTALAAKKPFSNTLEGKLVSIIGNKLVMTNQEGQERSHTLAEDVKLSLDGTACRAEDMKAGNSIRLTTRKRNRKAAAGNESPKTSGGFVKVN